VGCASCGAAEVLGIPRGEAAARLASGDIGFVLESDPKNWASLASFDARAPFYVALRAEALGAESAALAALHALSWERADGIVRREAGKRLIELESTRSRSDAPDSARFLARVRRFHKDYPDDRDARFVLASGLFESGDYGAVSALFPPESPAVGRERGIRMLAEVLGGGGEGAALRYFLAEEPDADYGRTLSALLEKRPEAFGGDPLLRAAERAARARIAVFNRSYGEALSLFRRTFADGPEFLFSYPEALSDLGKAFQFGGAASEGAALFERWAASAKTDDARFRLLFYAARMRRQTEDRELANRLFAEALPLAPDAAQRDACLWYVLDGAVSLSPKSALPLLRKFVPLWKNPASFADFLERYCGLLVAGRHWPELLETFRLIRPVADPATVARYAYVVGRAVHLGFIRADRPLELLGRIGAEDQDDPVSREAVARSFFRIAFESDSASFYYRTLAATFLGENLDPVPAEEGLNRFDSGGAGVGPAFLPKKARSSVESAERSPGLAFLFAFFDFGLGDRAYAYAQRFMADLSEDELRRLSARFNREGRYGDSIRTANALTRRPGYRLTREDMELLYPLAFSSEIAAAAERWGIGEEQLFGLVRTESAFIPDVVSRAGAVGLAQLMRPTAKDVERRIRNKVDLRYSGDEVDLSHPETNLNLGAWYLSSLNERLKSPLLSLFAYNGGITRVRRWRAAESAFPEDLFLETVPITETRTYASKVLASAAVYGYLYRGKTLAQVVSDFFPAAAQ